MNPAFNEGFNAKSAYDNPYWKNYPDEAPEEEKIKARVWVDGYVQQITLRGKGLFPDKTETKPA